MSEWLESFIATIAGGAVVLTGVLTIFKGLLIKLFETGIESSFEKNIEKFRNKLERTTRAYEMLLDKEMRFYEKKETIVAELIPLEQDLLYYLRHCEGGKHEQEEEKFRNHFKRYTKLIIVLKNEILIHQSYIPQEVFCAFSSVVKQMQDDLNYWGDMIEFMFSGEYEKIDYQKGEQIVDNFLKNIAFAEMKIHLRLKDLSGES